jgi:uncharacterized protein YrrD
MVAFVSPSCGLERGRCMYRARHLIGLPVVNVVTGERLASVRSLVIDLVGGQIQGLVVQRGSLFREPQVLHFEQLHAIGQDAILVKDGEKPYALPQLLAQLPWAQTEDKLFGRPVLTSDGKSVGALEDLFFDPHTGTISHYLLADGLLQSLLEGPAVMSAPSQPIMGEDRVIIPVAPEESVEQLMMEYKEFTGSSEV